MVEKSTLQLGQWGDPRLEALLYPVRIAALPGAGLDILGSLAWNSGLQGFSEKEVTTLLNALH